MKNLILALVVLASVGTAKSQALYESLLLLNQGAAAPIVPTDIANLFAWYKSDALVTNTAGSDSLSNGDSVMAWGDSSGNGRHLTTNRPATPPTWENAATTGKSFGGMQHTANQTLQVGFTAVPDSTIFIVWRNPASGGIFVIPLDSTNASARQVVYKNAGNAFAIASATEAAGGSIQQNTWYVQAGVFNSGGNDSLYTNGVAVSTSLTAGTQSLDGLNVGSSQSNTLPPGSDGWIGEIVIFNRNLNSTEIGQINTYLNGRWVIY